MQPRAEIYLDELFHRYPALEGLRPSITNAHHLLTEVFENGGKLLLIGNGGSASDADHFAGELLKGFRSKRTLPESFLKRLEAEGMDEQIAGKLQGSLPAIALPCQTAAMSAITNDQHPNLVFAQQVLGLGQKGDAILGITTSGKSKNILAAFSMARARSIHTIALTGHLAETIESLSDVRIGVPAQETTAVQEYHLPIYHALCAMVEAHFFPD